MESPYHGSTPISHGGESRPSLGFPLGTALLLVVIFSLSGIFSCCYHWDKLRRAFSIHADDLEAAHGGDLGYPSKPNNPHTDLKQQKNESYPVIMAGDNVPRFIALACPCEPPREGKIVVEVEKPPPRIAVPLF